MVVDNAEKEILFIVIAGKIMLDSVVYMDDLCSYDMSDISISHHHRINHSSLPTDKNIGAYEAKFILKGLSATFPIVLYTDNPVGG